MKDKGKTLCEVFLDEEKEIVESKRVKSEKETKVKFAPESQMLVEALAALN